MSKNNNEDGLRGLAIASIICGVVSWLVLAVVLAPMSAIFGGLALNTKDNSTRTMATIGLVIGVVSTALYLFSMIMIAHIK